MLDVAVFHLAQHPEMQEKAYDEIQVYNHLQVMMQRNALVKSKCKFK